MPNAQGVVIVGASVRAAAHSALRAGLRPWGVDLFADADLTARCPARRLHGRYPDAFAAALADAPLQPWLYTGGLENHPRLIETLARQRPLWGNRGSALTLCRSPERLSALAAEVGLGRVTVLGTVPPAGGRWLVKPRGGAGGFGIRGWTAGAALDVQTTYVQEFIEGVSASAVFVATAGECRLLGMTWQLVGAPWLHAPPFRYCGSVGPMPLEAVLSGRLRRLGQQFAEGCGVRGLFGVDGLVRDGQFWPVEVNPRYPASVEVLEHATGLRALDLHRCAFVPGEQLPPTDQQGERIVGKVVLYAPEDGGFPADGPWRDDVDPRRPIDTLPGYADVPHPGERLEAGQPVLTVLAGAATVAECLEQLRRRAAEVERLLFGSG